jgi:hypothetical protein
LTADKVETNSPRPGPAGEERFGRFAHSPAQLVTGGPFREDGPGKASGTVAAVGTPDSFEHDHV